jgi:formate hydrogenlyase subunit 3/multisubunit Na+/H+ antiporter MnhD subunit
MGVLYALMQHDLKRLLAYHTVENIGIIFAGAGLRTGQSSSCRARGQSASLSQTLST